VTAIEASLPELPDAKRERMQSQYGLSAYDAGVLVGDPLRAAFFEDAVAILHSKGGRDVKLVANWTLNDFSGRMAAEGIEFDAAPIKASEIAELVELIETDVISSKIAKQVFEHMWAGEGSPKAIVDKHGLVQVTDTGAIEAAIDEIMAANPDKVAAAKDKPQAIGWFVGQVMKATGGKAAPATVNALLKSKLGL